MFKLNKKWLYAAFSFALFSCNELEHNLKTTLNNSTEASQSNSNQIFTVGNLYAPSGSTYSANGQSSPTSTSWVKYNFSQNSVVDQTSENWDIAFRGTTIIVNGGSSDKDNISRTKEVKSALVEQTFDETTQIPDEFEFYQDENDSYAIPTGSGNGWYDYFLLSHTIVPIAGKTIVIKTHENKYVKMKIESYYKDQTPNSRVMPTNSAYYTFKFQFANEQNRFE